MSALKNNETQGLKQNYKMKWYRKGLIVVCRWLIITWRKKTVKLLLLFLTVTFLLLYYPPSSYLSSCGFEDQLCWEREVEASKRFTSINSLQMSYKIQNLVRINDDVMMSRRIYAQSPLSQLPVSQLLNAHLVVPNLVFYVWCGLRSFEFAHYINVLNVMRTIQPHTVMFYYEMYPQIDDMYYNTWLAEILDIFPYFTMQHATGLKACSADGTANLEFIELIISEHGGIYVNESIIPVNFYLENRKESSKIFRIDRTSIGIYLGSQNFKKQEKIPKHGFSCVSADEYNKNQSITCIHIPTSIFPKDIWALDSAFGRLVRTLFYGSPDILVPKPSYDTLIPNIAHLVWVGGRKMDFLMYLSVLSLLYVAKVEMVYIHGDYPPRGEYWDLLSNHQNITWVYRPEPSTVYGNSMSSRSHLSDAWRFSILATYGGIYCDADAIFVKHIDYSLRGYDAVAAYDWPPYHPFPYAINFGVTMGKRNALFWSKAESTLRWYRPGDWTFNGLRQPYRVYERNPQLLKIEPHLQAMCYGKTIACHPTWIKNHFDWRINHLTDNSLKNWRNDTYAMHWTWPTPDEFSDHRSLMKIKEDTLFSTMGKFVLQEANMLDYFKNL